MFMSDYATEVCKCPNRFVSLLWTINQAFIMDYALIQALKQFDTRRTEKLGSGESAVFTPDEKGAAMIADVFLPIAKYAVYGGHFHVEYMKGDDWFGYDIKFNKIELYYHDEIEGGHIDPIMYHTNLHTPYYLKDRNIKTYPYYEFGALNLHPSGIDISFENESKQYRASFLIRDFTVYNAKNDGVISKVKADPYSTHAFDWFFSNGINEATMKQLTLGRRYYVRTYKEMQYRPGCAPECSSIR